jgi:hypothetical protein
MEIAIIFLVIVNILYGLKIIQLKLHHKILT